MFAAVMSTGPPFSPGTALCRDWGGRVPDDYHIREIGDAGYFEWQRCRAGYALIATSLSSTSSVISCAAVGF